MRDSMNITTKETVHAIRIETDIVVRQTELLLVTPRGEKDQNSH
jgi:hypothetical protein